MIHTLMKDVGTLLLHMPEKGYPLDWSLTDDKEGYSVSYGGWTDIIGLYESITDIPDNDPARLIGKPKGFYPMKKAPCVNIVLYNDQGEESVTMSAVDAQGLLAAIYGMLVCIAADKVEKASRDNQEADDHQFNKDHEQEIKDAIEPE